jgi:hypothetical protein
VREHARIRGYLPAGHPLADVDSDAPLGLEALVYTRHAGRLAFLTPTRRRAYTLDRDGHAFAQVTTLERDGTASSATFRGADPAT